MSESPQKPERELRQDAIAFSSVEEYVNKVGGNKVIDTILIANNGIAAVKAIRSIRKWAYATFGKEEAIQFVVMATPEDLRANAEYIRMADTIEEVPGGPNSNNYANVDLIIEIAEKRGVQAVWAGWGHASENPKLPEKLLQTKNDIRFMGPPPKAMRDLGDKIASTLVAQSAQVSCVPWSGSGITLDYAKLGIPDDIFKQACVATLEEAHEALRKIGLPAMVKASEGGGGKGIRKVTKFEDLEAAFRQVQGEVAGSPIFLMKMLHGVRHLEIQVVADMFGNAISLYGRDCSVQRRHQKIIEEGPPVAAPESTWEEMEKAAVRLAKEVGYSGVGTVEYLYEAESNSYYFLELNPRLQVEHPVTELITDVNLPATQLNIAMGVPLDRIPDIRRLYGFRAYDQEPFDLDNMSLKRRPLGHVIAARITGENPEEGFKPTSGAIKELTFRSTPNVWGYFSVGPSGGLHEFADSQFGHIFSKGNTREEARKELIIGLRELSIRGDISTPVTYVSYLLETDTFKNNQATTEWLDHLIANRVAEQKPDPWLVVLCGALFRAYMGGLERFSKYTSFLQRGQIPPKELLGLEDFCELIYLNTKYAFKHIRTGENSFYLYLKGREKEGSVSGEVRSLSDGGLLILLNGKSYVCYGTDTISGLKLILDGKSCQFTTEYDPTELKSTTSGKLVRYLVENGSHVKAGTPYAEMEVMKMYLPLLVSEPGKITFLATEGAVLEAGKTIAKIELDDPSQVRRAMPFDGKLPIMKSPKVFGLKVHQLLRETIFSVDKTLQGFYQDNIQGRVKLLFQYLSDPHLPFLEFQECLSTIINKMPKPLYEKISVMLSEYQASLPSNSPIFNGKSIGSIIDSYCEDLSPIQKKELQPVLAPLVELTKKYESGLEKHSIQVVSKFLEDFLTIERNYSKPREQTILALREKFNNDMQRIFSCEISHANLPAKNRLMLALFDEIRDVHSFSHQLIPISELIGDEVPLKARRMLIISGLPSFEQRKLSIEKQLLSGNLQPLIGSSSAIADILTTLFHSPSPELRKAAMEVYLKRAYHAYHVHNLIAQIVDEDILVVTWYYGPHQVEVVEKEKESFEMKRAYTDATSDLVMLGHDSSLDEGLVLVFRDEQDMKDRFKGVFEEHRPVYSGKSHKPTGELNNVLKIVFTLPKQPEDSMVSNASLDAELIKRMFEFIQQFAEDLREAGTRRVTFLITTPGQFPRIFTFRERTGYNEDTIYRHIEPPLAFQLELRRLSNYNLQLCPTETKQIHVLYGEEKENHSMTRHCTLFARAVIRGGDSFLFANDTDRLNNYILSEAENVLVKSINAIELTLGDPARKNAWHNHIFLSFLPEVHLEPERVKKIIRDIAIKYEKRLAKSKVAEVEILGNLKKKGSELSSTSIRFITTNPTRAKFNTSVYVEVMNRITNKKVLSSLFGPAPLDGQEVGRPYDPPCELDRKRVISASSNTTYVYDFLELFEEALEKIWDSYLSQRPQKSKPKKLMEAKELRLNNLGEVIEVSKPPGENDVGMVAWKMILFTPEYPLGRTVILVANDITFQIGSFGPKEDQLFNEVSKMARKEGIPRIYIAANSGARIGLADEVKEMFQVEWNQEGDPTKGFKYIYVNDEDYKKLGHSIKATQVEPGKWAISDIIGLEDGLGVENLRGSGMIAGETSRAYEDIFTINLVTGRTVGIGAYLVRLGQRTIQNKGPVILTGASALNKVLGRDVYLSNDQLGGTQIMFINGVSHIIVNDELAGIFNILNWLSYIPKHKGAPVPILDCLDPIERPIAFAPAKAMPYDPRKMLAGFYDDKTNEWISGFFDKDSFTETLAGWGKTVVVGRARLGGIPLGVIAVETRTVEHVIPADPAVLESTEVVIQQAGQVWFPDSAYKTAQAIKDFNNGEELPLIIFANWRGFSGGLRDLYDEILKFGAYIVDNLREYRQPVLIYLPPQGELRGGAWVVVDPTINPEKMEMYADINSKGGVLEPNGIVEIKYKPKDIFKTMHRLDPQLKELSKKLRDSSLSELDKEAVRVEIAKRQAILNPIYHQVAIHFAELHDTPGRMKEKNVVREVLNWESSRKFFYYRLSRKLKEEYLQREIKQLHPSMTHTDIESWLRDQISIYNKMKPKTPVSWDKDESVVSWIEKESTWINQQMAVLRDKYIQNEAMKLMQENHKATLQGILQALSLLPPSQKAAIIKQIRLL